MSYEGQYKSIKKVARHMLLDAGIIEDEDFDLKVSDMAIHILEDLYNQNFSNREINNAITVLLAAIRL